MFCLLSADGNYLLSCGSDKSLKLWSVSRGTLLKNYSGHGYEVLDADGWVCVVTLKLVLPICRAQWPMLIISLCIHHRSYDNSQICSCSSDKTVILWDVASGQVTRKLRGHAGVSEEQYLWSMISTRFCHSFNTFCLLLLFLESQLCAVQWRGFSNTFR